MALTRKSQAYQSISAARLALTEGIVCCIDPSIGSNSSMPGYAVYRTGELVASGIFEIDPSGTLPERAQELAYHVRRFYQEWEPDVLVYEEIPVMGAGRSASGHVTLLKAVGIILSVSGPNKYVGLYPSSWKKLARPEYVKGDENDAVEMGYVAISEARKIIEEDGKKADRKFGQSKGNRAEES